MYDRNLLKDIAFLEKMLTEPNITDNYSLKEIIDALNENVLLKELNRLKKRQENRKYEPRILKNVEIGEKHE